MIVDVWAFTGSRMPPANRSTGRSRTSPISGIGRVRRLACRGGIDMERCYPLQEMDNSAYRHEVERFVREKWLAARFGQYFTAKDVGLTDGGVFNCAAVSEDGRIIASICSNAGKTSRGRTAAPKLMKVRSDILFMLRSAAERRLVITTCQDMHAL